MEILELKVIKLNLWIQWMGVLNILDSDEQKIHKGDKNEVKKHYCRRVKFSLNTIHKNKLKMD